MQNSCQHACLTNRSCQFVKLIMATSTTTEYDQQFLDFDYLGWATQLSCNAFKRFAWRLRGNNMQQHGDCVGAKPQQQHGVLNLERCLDVAVQVVTLVKKSSSKPRPMAKQDSTWKEMFWHFCMKLCKKHSQMPDNGSYALQHTSEFFRLPTPHACTPTCVQRQLAEFKKLACYDKTSVVNGLLTGLQTCRW